MHRSLSAVAAIATLALTTASAAADEVPANYACPASVDEALALLAEHGDEAKVLAGGQSLVPLLNMRFAAPGVARRREPRRRPRRDRRGGRRPRGRRARAAARRSARSAAVARRLPLAASALPFVGHFATRNRGTVGGSIAHADAARRAAARALSPSAARSSRPRARPAHDPRRRPLRHALHDALEPDELLVETRLARRRAGTGPRFEEFAQRHGDFALGMAACALRVRRRPVAEARIALGAVADRPTLVADGRGAARGARGRRGARARGRSGRGGRRSIQSTACTPRRPTGGI